MPDLTPKQESFAQKYIETGNASEAYRQAYDTENMKLETIHRNACALLDSSKVATRVEELQALAQERHAVTLDSLTKEYNEAKGVAYGLDQTGAAIQAINGKAKIHGFDRQVIDATSKVIVKIVDLTGKKDD